MEEGDGVKELFGEGLDVRAREGHEATLLEEVEDGEAEKRCHDADMAAPVEAVTELDAAVDVVCIGSAKGLEDAQFDTGSVTVLLRVSMRVQDACNATQLAAVRWTYLWHSPNDLDGHLLP